jgi:lipopolysaccharide export LptBFGC system permease protein LptF
MVFTLHRYIFRELLRLFVLATLALTLILSLGSVLWPMQEYGVGPRQVLHFMGYFLPITLTFVLPMAALFAASLVYGRFAGDNELDACKASGISLLTLVYPGLVLAIVVAIANLILSFHVMPVFVHRAEESIKADAKQILFRNIRQKGYYELPPDKQYLIYADRADDRNDTLSGVVVVKLGGQTIERIITAESAKISFDPSRRFQEVRISARRPYQMNPSGEGGFSFESLSLTTEFGSLLGDEIKFKKLDEMKKIRDVDLMLFDPVARIARRIYAQFATELLAQDIAAKITNSVAGYYRLHSGQTCVEFSADRITAKAEKEVELTGNVVVNEFSLVPKTDYVQKQRLRTLRAEKASIYIEGDELMPTLAMEIRDPTWEAAGGTEEPAWGPVRIRGLVLPETIEAVTNQYRREHGLRVEKLRSQPQALSEPSPRLAALRNELDKTVWETLADIKAETHSRLVFGTGCVPMILIGIGLGIMLKGGHLLSAFGAGCVPAAVLIVCIMMGKNITKNPGAQAGSGVVLMWVGVLLLGLLAIGIYRRLLKN